MRSSCQRVVRSLGSWSRFRDLLFQTDDSRFAAKWETQPAPTLVQALQGPRA